MNRRGALYGVAPLFFHSVIFNFLLQIFLQAKKKLDNHISFCEHFLSAAISHAAFLVVPAVAIALKKRVVKMRRFSGGLVCAILCLLCSAAAMAATAHGGPHWGYGGKEGPRQWGSLSPDFATCDSGRAQSPIAPIHSGTVSESGHGPLALATFAAVSCNE